MVMSEAEDTLTQINTALNRSMVLMENGIRTSTTSPKDKSKKSRKSITINTGAVKATSTPLQDNAMRKSILKRKERDIVDETAELHESLHNDCPMETTETTECVKVVDRPHNLEEFMNSEKVIPERAKQTYTLEDVDPDDDLWIIDIPKSVDPRDLQGKVLRLGEKTKIKIAGEKYQATSHETDDCLTCVFGTGKEVKPFKIVNIRPSGTITMRKKLVAVAPVTEEMRTDEVEKETVPFPKGVKPRDPFAGVSETGKIKKKSKIRVKKLHSLE